MAETIVSPGVFTRERDLSFLPQGVAEIGAVFVGPTVKGPAFVPTQVQSFNEFQQKFGPLTDKSYLPYSVQSYLQDAPNATIVRVLGKDFKAASTQWVSGSGTIGGLFKFHTVSHGEVSNHEVKVYISNLRPPKSVPGTNYGDFQVTVRRVDTTTTQSAALSASYYFGSNIEDNDRRPNIVEQFYNVNLDPSSPQYIKRVIGDRYMTVVTGSGTDWKLASNGDYPNNSIYIRVEVTGSVDDGDISYSDAMPQTGSAGWLGVTSSMSFTGGENGTGFSASNAYMGDQIIPSNTQGFDCSSATSEGTKIMKGALSIVGNPDEVDMNMLILPGFIHAFHPFVTDAATDLCEERGDAFYVMDLGGLTASIAEAVAASATFDSNYVATYYPWVKILDTAKNKPMWVPPSVVLPGVIAFNDQVAAEWYAPAGLNRGGLPNVIDVKERLKHSERDTLYVARINPIATFPGQGATVFGQKTLQSRPSALDRINVRRLLIAVKKFIASTSRYLLFEQNTAATRNRFLSIVNPYLESIQQRNGLYAFKVVMDDTNNTMDMIDRNMLKGDIFLQPTKTAEFIVLDFTVLPTGAVFPE